MAAVSRSCVVGSKSGPGRTGSARLDDWLSWQETLHESTIELGLDRCREVARRMGLLPLPFPVVTMAGTNGKGSTAALLEAMLTSAGHRTGVYASPHLVRFNECVRVGSEPASDDALIDAFVTVERARGATALTAFEFRTLAAVELMCRAEVEIAVLEVGLGGARDAVNLFDPCIAVLTTIALDHTQWLGRDRASIAREKCGIFRLRRPVVCGDPEPPGAVLEAAGALGAPVSVQGRDFRWRPSPGGWRWSHAGATYEDLPAPALNGRCQYRNSATALMAVHHLRSRFPVCTEAVRCGLGKAFLPARQEVRPGSVERIIDVAHNVEAVRALGQTLGARRCHGRTLAVFSMLADKDPAGCVAALDGRVDAWFVGGTTGSRGMSAEAVVRMARLTGPGRDVDISDRAESAFRRAMAGARVGDRVVVFGSFHTARAAMRVDELARGGIEACKSESRSG